MRDEAYCGPVVGGEPGDRLVLVGGADPLDHINFCPRPEVIPAGSPEYNAMLPLFGTPPTP